MIKHETGEWLAKTLSAGEFKLLKKAYRMQNTGILVLGPSVIDNAARKKVIEALGGFAVSAVRTSACGMRSACMCMHNPIRSIKTTIIHEISNLMFDFTWIIV